MGGLVSAPQDLVPARRLGAALRALVTKYFRKACKVARGECRVNLSNATQA